MNKIFLLISFVLSIDTGTIAQILTMDKTDTLPYQKKTVIKGLISLGIEGDKEKKLVLDATNVADLQLQRNKDLFILAASYRFTYNGTEDFLNTGYALLRWRHGYKNTWQPESFVQYQWDGSRGLLHRLIGGYNARYTFWHKEKWELCVGSGFIYETELWSYSAVDSALKPRIINNKLTSLIKTNNYVRWEGKTSSNSNLALVIFYQSPINDLFSSYRIASSIHFDVGMSKNLKFGFNFSSLYDAKPIVPILKFYYSFSNTLIYKF